MDNLVKKFMTLIDIRKNINNITDNDVALFLKQLSSNNADILLQSYIALPKLPPNSRLITSGIKGQSGELLFCQIDHKACWKRIQLPVNSYEAFASEFLKIIQESFIQFILSNDTRFGSKIPKIFNIFGVEDNIYIKMEFSGIQLYDVLRQFKPKIPFLTFQSIMKDILQSLDYFNRVYHFAHRDLHIGNILVDKKQIKFIDFGMACITITTDKGASYNISSLGGPYLITSPCRSEQDISILLLGMYQFIYKMGDGQVKEFLDNVFDSSFFYNVQHRVPADGELAHGAYNYNDTLLPQHLNTLSVKYVLSKLLGRDVQAYQRISRRPFQDDKPTGTRRLLSQTTRRKQPNIKTRAPPTRRLLSHRLPKTITRRSTRVQTSQR